MLLVVNKVLPDIDFGVLKDKVHETYQLPVVGILLLDGKVECQQIEEDEIVIVDEVESVNFLNKLEILGNLETVTTVMITSSKAYFLVIEGSILDELIEQDKRFASNVIEQESRQLQQLQQFAN